MKKCGSNYTYTDDFDPEKARDLVEEFIAIVKIKDLTIRQAQQLFLVCADYILDSDLK